MIALTSDMMHRICPGTAPARLALFVEPLNQAFSDYEIDTTKRAAFFLGQYGHETGGFTKLEENLNYSAERLCFVWPKRFPNVDAAAPFAHNPEALANKVYANRNGNGDEDSGDGYLYRGRGLPHLTGRANYERAAEALNLDLLGNPERLIEPGPAVLAGCYFWASIKGNEFADAEEFEALTRAINGGLNGLDSREAYRARAEAALEAG